MAKETFLHKGMTFVAETPSLRGWSLTRFQRETLNDFHVPHYDACCPNSNGGLLPVGLNADSELVGYNSTTNVWDTISTGGSSGGVTVIDNQIDFDNLAPTNGGLYLLIARGSTGSYINSIVLTSNADITEVLDVTNTPYADPFRIGNGVLTGLFIAKQDYTYSSGTYNPSSTFKLKQLV